MAKKPARVHLNTTQIAIVAVIAAVTLFMIGYTNRLIKAQELRGEVVLWEEEKAQAQARVDEHSAYLQYVQTDQYVLEKGKTDLGWALPNEVAVWVLGRVEEAVDAGPEAAAAPVPYWQQWQAKFFDPQ